ncbi:hypothetical protein PV326_012934 [Microctonus aethiopoides]|nr:hypothetical protein PV326_012934 [Microctonus aethiopoides]
MGLIPFMVPSLKLWPKELSDSGIQGRILELHSPDGVHECWLKASDNAEANVWFNALHSALANLTLKALRLASVLPDPTQLQHIGWLARRHCVQDRDDDNNDLSGARRIYIYIICASVCLLIEAR